MMVAGGDVGLAPLQHQARQAQAAAQLQDAFARDLEAAHRLGQHPARGPDLAEQTPLRRRNAGPFGPPLRIGELLEVAQRADAVVVAAEAEGKQAGGIARHGRSRGGVVPPEAERERGRERNEGAGARA